MAVEGALFHFVACALCSCIVETFYLEPLYLVFPMIISGYEMVMVH